MRRATRSLDFDGVNEYGRGVSPSTFNWEYTQPFTVSAWFKRTDIDDYIWAKMDAVPKGLGFGFAGGALLCLIMNSVSLRVRVVTTSSYNDGNWHFAVMTWDGSGSASGITVYVDGVAVATSTTDDTLASNTVLNSYPFNIGARSNGSAAYAGSLHSVALWNRVLTAEEVWEAWNLGNPRDLLVHSANSDLVGWWPLGELGTWPYVYDLSGNRNYVQLINMETGDVSEAVPRGQSRQTSKSLVFGGTDEYVTMGDVLGFERVDTPFTLACWVKIPSFGSDMALLGKAQSTTPSGYGIFITSAGKFAIALSNTSATNEIVVETSSALSIDTWYFCCATYNGTSSASGVALYINGVAVSTSTTSDTLSSTILNTASFELGRFSDIGFYLIGTMDEASVWDAVLSPSQIAELYNGGTGILATETSAALNLVGYWRCGDYDTSPTITDLSSNSGNDGTMTNMETADIQGDVPPWSGYLPVEEVIAFNGTDEYITMGNVLGYDRLDAWTISFWIQTTTTSGFIIGKQLGSTPWTGYGVSVSSSAINVELINTTSGNWIQVRSANLINTGVWTHVCVTYDGSSSASGVTIYFNSKAVGVSILQNSLTASIATSNEFRIASRDTGWFTSGKLSHAAIWNTELTSAQVVDVFNGGAPPNLLELSTAANLTGWWVLGAGDTGSAVRDGSLAENHGTPSGIDWSNFLYDTPIPYADGGEALVLDMYAEAPLLSFAGHVVDLGAIDYPPAARLYFRMRGWNTSLLDWELWTSVDTPDLTPPVGPCVNISIEAFWD